MKWYKHDPELFKGGTLGLSLEEIGAYVLILDDIYARNGVVPDDERYLCRLLRCDPRVCRRLRGRLLGLGKLQTDGQLLSNLRATYELSSAEVRAKLASSSAQKRWKINETSHAASHAERITEVRSKKEVKKESASHSPKKAARKSARPMCEFPADWIPSDLQPAEQIEFDRFRDSARAHARKYADWPAAWRNWKRSPYQQQRAGNGQSGQVRPKSGITTAIDGLIEQLERDEEAGGVPRQTDLRMLPGGRS